MSKIIDGMSNKEYHSTKGLSASSLGLIKKSISLLKWSWNLGSQVDEEARNLVVGSATHALVLEGREVYENEFCVAPEFNMRTNQGKEDFKKFKEENTKSILTSVEAEQIEAMAKSVFAHPTASKLLEKGKPEQSFFWNDKDTLEDCKIRPDWLNIEDRIIVDLKTTKDTFNLSRSVFDYGYHRQASWYKKGFEAVTGKELEKFIFIFVSKSKSLGRYEVRVLELDEQFMDLGRYENSILLEKYTNAQMLNEWFEIETLSPQKWMID